MQPVLEDMADASFRKHLKQGVSETLEAEKLGLAWIHMCRLIID